MQGEQNVIVYDVSGSEKPSASTPIVPSIDVEELAGAPLRPRDSMGALRPSQARIDEALAMGYAQGLEEAQTEALDDARTLLVAILETRFGPLENDDLDHIAEADLETVHRWMVQAVQIAAVGELFAKI